VGINHLGDWGTQFGKMIYAYKTWGNKEDVEKMGVAELVRLYVKFHEEAEKDPSLDDEGRRWFKAIEDGDEEALSIFNWFKELTLRDAKPVYEMLGVEFDSYHGESFYADKTAAVVEELTEKNLITLSEGAKVVDLDQEKSGMPPCIIIKKDGTRNMKWFPKCKLTENTDATATSSDSHSDQNDTLTIRAYGFDADQNQDVSCLTSETANAGITEDAFFAAPLLTVAAVKALRGVTGG
jgi:hypothetical protein